VKKIEDRKRNEPMQSEKTTVRGFPELRRLLKKQLWRFPGLKKNSAQSESSLFP
jgi:hypothetical protein